MREDRSFGRGDPVRDYWVVHSEGFRVEGAEGTEGVVEAVEYEPTRPLDARLRVRRGTFGGGTVVRAADVEEVVPGRELLVLEGAAQPIDETRSGTPPQAVPAGAVVQSAGDVLRRVGAGVVALASAVVALVSALLVAVGDRLRSAQDSRNAHRARRVASGSGADTPTQVGETAAERYERRQRARRAAAARREAS